MKFIHTGDWHIGKIVNEFSMLENQEKFLEDLIVLMKKENPDALIIAGDLYDRSVPPANAVELLNKYLNKIINDLKIPVLAIAGNHDSAERLSFGSEIMKGQGLYIEGVLKKVVEKVTIKDTDFYLIPYFDPATIRKLFENDEIRDHEDAMRLVVDEINKTRDTNRNAVIVAHGYVTSINFDKSKPRKEILEDIEIVESDSERPLTMGGTEFISGKIFEGFDYVALGHIHEPKRVSVNNDVIRYSGSPLKYSVSEKNHKNSVAIVELSKDGVVVKEEKIVPLREIRVLKGNLEDLISKDFYMNQKTDDYIHFILTDDGELYEPMAKLKSVYKNALSLEREYKRVLDQEEVSLKIEDINKNKVELFKDFYENVTGMNLSEKRLEIINEIIEKVEGER
ncbi:MAG: exonuclease SbcCD subunit D [Sarcina sp.]